jgi:hypothetical protein
VVRRQTGFVGRLQSASDAGTMPRMRTPTLVGSCLFWLAVACGGDDSVAGVDPNRPLTDLTEAEFRDVCAELDMEARGDEQALKGLCINEGLVRALFSLPASQRFLNEGTCDLVPSDCPTPRAPMSSLCGVVEPRLCTSTVADLLECAREDIEAYREAGRIGCRAFIGNLGQSPRLAKCPLEVDVCFAKLAP